VRTPIYDGQIYETAVERIIDAARNVASIGARKLSKKIVGITLRDLERDWLSMVFQVYVSSFATCAYSRHACEADEGESKRGDEFSVRVEGEEGGFLRVTCFSGSQGVRAPNYKIKKSISYPSRG